MTSDQHAPTAQRFLRTKEDRYLAGVGGGLGRAFGVDPIIFRILLVGLFLAGGLGFFFYLAAILVVPSDDGSGQAAPRGSGDTLRRLIVVSAVVIGATALFAVLFGGAAWATAAGGGIGVAIIVLGLGSALLIGAARGDHRFRWLVLPALALAFPATVVGAADISLDGGIGERSYRPAGTERLPATYRLGVGELVVDLRRLDWSGARQERLQVDVSVGHALVLVPPEVCVSSRVKVTAGHVEVLGRMGDGVDIDQDLPRTPSAGAPGLQLEGAMSTGAFQVFHRDPRKALPKDEDDKLVRQQRATADRACAGARR